MKMTFSTFFRIAPATGVAAMFGYRFCDRRETKPASQGQGKLFFFKQNKLHRQRRHRRARRKHNQATEKTTPLLFNHRKRNTKVQLWRRLKAESWPSREPRVHVVVGPLALDRTNVCGDLSQSSPVPHARTPGSAGGPGILSTASLAECLPIGLHLSRPAATTALVTVLWRKRLSVPHPPTNTF